VAAPDLIRPRTCRILDLACRIPVSSRKASPWSTISRASFAPVGAHPKTPFQRCNRVLAWHLDSNQLFAGPARYVQPPATNLLPSFGVWTMRCLASSSLPRRCRELNRGHDKHADAWTMMRRADDSNSSRFDEELRYVEGAQLAVSPSAEKWVGWLHVSRPD
jgi:hypothetical protein